MDNKKIPTILGTIVIIIIAVTVGVFVWKYESIKSQEDAETQSEIVKIAKPVEEKQSPQKEENEKPIDTSKWKVCRSEKYNYEFKYPDRAQAIEPGPQYIKSCADRAQVPIIGVSQESIKFILQDKAISKPDIYSLDKSINSLDDYLKNSLQASKERFNIEEINIQNEKAFLEKDKQMEKQNRNVLVTYHQNRVYHLDITGFTEQETTSIINSFKFIK